MRCRAAHGDADLWVVALGTNDAGQYPASQYPDLIALMLDRIGADHLTMWVNTYMPTRARLQAAWNSALNDVAEQRPDELVVYDWAAYAAGHSGWLGADSIHYTSVRLQGAIVGSSRGGDHSESAIQRLSTHDRQSPGRDNGDRTRRLSASTTRTGLGHAGQRALVCKQARNEPLISPASFRPGDGRGCQSHCR